MHFKKAVFRSSYVSEIRLFLVSALGFRVFVAKPTYALSLLWQAYLSVITSHSTHQAQFSSATLPLSLTTFNLTCLSRPLTLNTFLTAM